MDSATLTRIADILRDARAIAVLTGAGVSAESGIPTFRDAQTGLWARYQPQDLATPEAFEKNPKLVWEWYAWRRGLIQGAEPNAAHRALAAMQAQVDTLTLITQNVDGLHQRAGSFNIIELHGNIHRSKCFVEHVVIEDQAARPGTPPQCPHCGAFLRPDVVWFGEMLPIAALEEANRAAQECDVFLSIGTSAAVYPAAQLPYTAQQAGATVIEINKDPTPLSAQANFPLLGLAAKVLPELICAAWKIES